MPSCIPSSSSFFGRVPSPKQHDTVAVWQTLEILSFLQQAPTTFRLTSKMLLKISERFSLLFPPVFVFFATVLVYPQSHALPCGSQTTIFVNPGQPFNFSFLIANESCSETPTLSCPPLAVDDEGFLLFELNPFGATPLDIFHSGNSTALLTLPSSFSVFWAPSGVYLSPNAKGNPNGTAVNLSGTVKCLSRSDVPSRLQTIIHNNGTSPPLRRRLMSSQF